MTPSTLPQRTQRPHSRKKLARVLSAEIQPIQKFVEAHKNSLQTPYYLIDETRLLKKLKADRRRQGKVRGKGGARLEMFFYLERF